jgi:hypothetical protein
MGSVTCLNVHASFAMSLLTPNLILPRRFAISPYTCKALELAVASLNSLVASSTTH